MAAHDCFDHACPGEPNVPARLHDFLSGATAWAFGENIAWGEGPLGTPRAIVLAWMDGPPHRENILNPRFERFGAGVEWSGLRSSGAPSGTYTTDFGFTR